MIVVIVLMTASDRPSAAVSLPSQASERWVFAATTRDSPVGEFTCSWIDRLRSVPSGFDCSPARCHLPRSSLERRLKRHLWRNSLFCRRSCSPLLLHCQAKIARQQRREQHQPAVDLRHHRLAPRRNFLALPYCSSLPRTFTQVVVQQRSPSASRCSLSFAGA